MTPRKVLRPERGSLAVIVVLTLLATMAEAGFLLLVTRVGLVLGTDATSIALPAGAAIPIAGALAAATACALLRFAGGLGSSWLASRALARVAIRMRTQLVTGWLDASWSHKSAIPRGQVQQLLSSFTQTAATVVTAASRAVVAVVALSALLVTALALQPALTLAAAAVVAVLSLSMIPLRRLVRRHTTDASDAQLAYAASVHEAESLAMEIQVLGVRDAAADRVVATATEAATTLRASQFSQTAVSPAYQLIAAISLVVLLVLGLRSGVDDVATIGAVLLLLLRSLSYAQSLQVARAQFVGAKVYLDQLADREREFLDAVEASAVERRPGDAGASLVSDGLTFHYDDHQAALQDVTFALEPGEIVGLVGPSGAGKSTLVELLLGLRPSTGRVRLGALELDAVDRIWWSAHVAYVPQQQELLTGTVAENIRFLRPDISDADVRDALVAAALWDDVVALPDGVDTHLGERGSRLSGGQRQRLCIARALAARPSILVLDEPTSALDHGSEAAVLTALAALANTTVILVTHRPAALDICDRVMTLDGGRVIDLSDRTNPAKTLPGPTSRA